MTVVESLRRVRGSDIGVLTRRCTVSGPTSDGRDVDDALVRVCRRVQTTAVTRLERYDTRDARLGPARPGVPHRGDPVAGRPPAVPAARRFCSSCSSSTSGFRRSGHIVAVQEVLVPSLPSSVPTPAGESNRLGVGVDQFARVGRSTGRVHAGVLPLRADSGGRQRPPRRKTGRQQRPQRAEVRCDCRASRRRVHLAVLAGRVDDGHQPRRVRRPITVESASLRREGSLLSGSSRRTAECSGPPSTFLQGPTATYRSR